MEKTIGIIGCGNMGSAIVERLKSRYQVYAFDKDKNKTKDIPGAQIAKDNIDLVNKVDIVILAVKPQDFDAVLDEIKRCAKDKLVVSIAAGITTGYIEKTLGNVKVIRVMPNMAAKIGKAESCLCKGRNANDEDLNFVRELFNCIGKTWVMKEEMIDAATAISGSGPAYIYYDMEVNKIDPQNVQEEVEQEYIKRLKKAAERVGFDAKTALDLASSTTGSSIELVKVTMMPPAELIKQIASKGGTTEAALKILKSDGSWEDAAEAAKKQAEKLSKKG